MKAPNARNPKFESQDHMFPVFQSKLYLWKTVHQQKWGLQQAPPGVHAFPVPAQELSASWTMQ